MHVCALLLWWCRAHAQSNLSILGALSGEPHIKRILDALTRHSPSPTAKWLKHVSSVLAGALVVVNQLYCKRQSVLVHCSDGWDRTVYTQRSAAQL
jgi:hypothetical protein